MVRWGSNPRLSSCSRPCSTKRLRNNSATQIYKSLENSQSYISNHLIGKAKEEGSQLIMLSYTERRDVTGIMRQIPSHNIMNMLCIRLYFLTMNHLKSPLWTFVKAMTEDTNSADTDGRQSCVKRWKTTFLLTYCDQADKDRYMNKGKNTQTTCKDRHTHTPTDDVQRETTEVFLEEELYREGKVSV